MAQSEIDFSITVDTGQDDDTLQKIKRGIERGEVMTVLDATRDYNTVDLRKYISLLRAAPYSLNIVDEWRKNQATKKRFKAYWLAKSETPAVV